MTIEIKFTKPAKSPEKLLADAEIQFKEGPLAGMRLVGLAVRKNASGEPFVTLPSRELKSDGDKRQFFEMLRATDGSAQTINSFKGWVLNQYSERGVERVAESGPARGVEAASPARAVSAPAR